MQTALMLWPSPRRRTDRIGRRGTYRQHGAASGTSRPAALSWHVRRSHRPGRCSGGHPGWRPHRFRAAWTRRYASGTLPGRYRSRIAGATLAWWRQWRSPRMAAESFRAAGTRRFASGTSSMAASSHWSYAQPGGGGGQSRSPSMAAKSSGRAQHRAVSVWDLASGRLERTFAGAKGCIQEASAFRCRSLPDGRRVVSGGWDNALRVWSVESGHLERTLHGQGQLRVCGGYHPR